MAGDMLMVDFAKIAEAKTDLNGAAGNVQTGISSLTQAEPEADANVKALVDLNTQITSAIQALERATTSVQASLSKLVPANDELNTGLTTIKGRVFPKIEEGSRGKGSAQLQGFLTDWHTKVDPLEQSVQTMSTTSHQMEGLMGQLKTTTTNLQNEFTQVLDVSKKLLSELQQTNQQLNLHEKDLEDSIPTLQQWINRLESQDHL